MAAGGRPRHRTRVHVRARADRRRPTTADELRAELAVAGTDLLVDRLRAGLATPTPQAGEPTYAAKIDPAELELDWTHPADELDRVVRVGRRVDDVPAKRLLGARPRRHAPSMPRPARVCSTRRDRRHRRRRARAPRGAARRTPADAGDGVDATAPASRTASGSDDKRLTLRGRRAGGGPRSAWCASSTTGPTPTSPSPPLLDAHRPLGP